MNGDEINRVLRRIWALGVSEHVTLVDAVELYGRALASVAMEVAGGDPHAAAALVRSYGEQMAQSLTERKVAHIYTAKGGDQHGDEEKAQEATQTKARTGVLSRRGRRAGRH